MLQEDFSDLTETDAYMIGLFMAEGSFAKVGDRFRSAQFSIHEDESHLIEKIGAFGEKFDREVKVYGRAGSRGVSARIHSHAAAAFLHEHTGEYAHLKYASEVRSAIRRGVEIGAIKEIWRSHYKGPVFNFETENNTYVAGGIAVHNCEHLRSMLNYIFPDGRKVFAYNYFPRFFDISIVTVPADRSAYSLKKVAEFVERGEAQAVWSPGMDFTTIIPVEPSSRTVTGFRVDYGESVVPMGMEKFAGLFEYLASGGTKEADIDKIVPAESKAEEVSTTPLTPDVMDIVKKLVAQDRAASNPMGAEVVSKLKQFPLNKVLSGLTSLGIVLPDADADRIIGDQPLPENLDSLDFPQEEPTLINVLKRLVGERSMFDPHFSIRIMRISREGGESGEPKSITLVKRGSASRYREWLRTRVDLEKLAERIRQPEVQAVLFPGELEKEIVGLSKDPDIGRPDALVPFIAEIGA